MQTMEASRRVFQAPKVRRIFLHIPQEVALINCLIVFQDMYNSVMDFQRFLRKGESLYELSFASVLLKQSLNV